MATCPPLPRTVALNLPFVPGDLPAIATYAGIEAARCAWRWQAGGRRVAGRLGVVSFENRLR